MESQIEQKTQIKTHLADGQVLTVVGTTQDVENHLETLRQGALLEYRDGKSVRFINSKQVTMMEFVEL